MVDQITEINKSMLLHTFFLFITSFDPSIVCLFAVWPYYVLISFHLEAKENRKKTLGK